MILVDKNQSISLIVVGLLGFILPVFSVFDLVPESILQLYDGFVLSLAIWAMNPLRISFGMPIKLRSIMPFVFAAMVSYYSIQHTESAYMIIPAIVGSYVWSIF